MLVLFSHKFAQGTYYLLGIFQFNPLDEARIKVSEVKHSFQVQNLRRYQNLSNKDNILMKHFLKLMQKSMVNI